MFRDNHNLIVQADGDGGDTCQRTGMWYFGRALREGVSAGLREEFAANLMWLYSLCAWNLNFGQLIRHPGKDDGSSAAFWSDPKRLSRDQQDAMVIALGELCYDRQWRSLFFAAKSRWFFYQNKDLPTLQSFGVWIRSGRVLIAWPLLMICDMGLLLNAFIKIFKRNPDNSDDVNHIMRITQAQRIMGTPISWLARKIYKKTRPKCFGHIDCFRSDFPESVNYVETDRIMATLAWYFRKENGGNPEFVELYRPIVKEF
jgi:hypothetical protein